MLLQTLNGLVYGGLLYILAVGLVLIFGLRRVVNFAHGSLFMVGAYVGYSIATYFGNFWLGLVVSVAVLAVLGVFLDAVVFRPLQREDPIVTVLVTFAILLVLEDAVRSIWGKDFLSLKPPPALAGTVQILGESFPTYRLFVIVLAAAVAIGLYIYIDGVYERSVLVYQRLSKDIQNNTIWCRNVNEAFTLFTPDYIYRIKEIKFCHDIKKSINGDSRKTDSGMELVRWFEKRNSVDWKHCSFTIYGHTQQDLKMCSRLHKAVYNVKWIKFGE